MNETGTSYPGITLPYVVTTMRALVGMWGWKRFLSQPLVMLLYRRLGEIDRAVARLLARFQAGHVMTRAARSFRVVDDVSDAAAVPVARAERVWPLEFGWLVRRAAHEAAIFEGQLRIALGQPEMVALLAACPQARRVLVPLCRMLAVDTAILRPRVEGAVFPVLVKRVRVRRAAAPVESWRIPLPRGILPVRRRRGGFEFGG